MKKKRNDIDGYSVRHLAQLIRRNMIQKNHGDENKYTRKNKHKGDYEKEE
jgi:hypothetical protein|tara:strand:+ start:462 stop:611 length:150 start_codon:yes stop_codon:yes gene_type:complete